MRLMHREMRESAQNDAAPRKLCCVVRLCLALQDTLVPTPVVGFQCGTVANSRARFQVHFQRFRIECGEQVMRCCQIHIGESGPLLGLTAHAHTTPVLPARSCAPRSPPLTCAKTPPPCLRECTKHGSTRYRSSHIGSCPIDTAAPAEGISGAASHPSNVLSGKPRAHLRGACCAQRRVLCRGRSSTLGLLSMTCWRVLQRWSSSREGGRCGSRGGEGDPCICVRCESAAGSWFSGGDVVGRGVGVVGCVFWGSGTWVGRCVRGLRFLVDLGGVGGLEDFG